MIIDNKGKLFGKIHLLDLLIIIVLIAGVGYAGLRFTKAKSVTPFTKLDKIQTVIYAEEVPQYTAEAIKPGDVVKDPMKNVVLGYVKSVKIGPSVSYGVSDQGKWMSSPKEGYASIYITAEGEGIYSDGKTKSGVTFDNAEFWIGRLMEMRAGNTAMMARIYEMKKID